MITKEQFIQSLVHELNIIKHLAEKVDSTKLDYKPTPAQRSTLELMQYLGHTFQTAITAYIAGDQNVYIELSKNKDLVTFENFQEKMDDQIKFATASVGALTDADLKQESTIWGNSTTLAMHLMSALKNAVAYKMQLFLYIKASGNDKIGTSNVWAGRDLPPKEE